MDIGTLGINVALIAGIIALTAVVKKLDVKGRLKRVYVLIPLALGILAAVLVTTPLEWQGVGVNAIIYAGIASYFYSAGKKLSIAGITVDPAPEPSAEPAQAVPLSAASEPPPAIPSATSPDAGATP
jgi:Ca2+/Na+ antiporter